MTLTDTTTTGPEGSVAADRPYQDEYGHLIGGQWVPGSTGATIPLRNPATGQTLAHIQAGNATDATRAVDAASAAFPSWSQTTPSERQAILYEIAKRLRANTEKYAMLETLNNGKPIMEARYFDLPMAIEQFEIFAGAPWRLHGESLTTPDGVGIIHREPLGTCAQIIPWNVPMIMMAAKVAPALAAGNTIVLKPSEIVCLSVLEFFKDMADIIPPGVVNVVTAYGPDIGESLVTDPRVRKVAFTGSRPTARKLMQLASVNIIPQTMELGGKSANIVCADADLTAAAEGVAQSMILNKGEVCLAGSRVLVEETVRDEFLDTLQRMLGRVNIGDPTSDTTHLGAQASQAQMDKVMGYLDIGPQEGANVLIGGGRKHVDSLPDGFFVEPTVFDGVDNSMRIAQEEIFGPVATVQTWSDEDDMMRLANGTDYGLGGGLWTRDLARAHRLARQLETGTIWVNRYYNFVGNMPIGGYKQSGFGREFSDEVLNHYTLTKSVVIDLDGSPQGTFGS